MARQFVRCTAVLYFLITDQGWRALHLAVERGAMTEPASEQGGLPRVGVIVLGPGYQSVAVVKYEGVEGWQFPSQPGRRGMSAEYAAVEVAASQLGLAIQDTLCLEPALHALGPIPGQTTKFLLAFNVTEVDLDTSPDAAPAPLETAWQPLQQLLAETEGQTVHGNQLVAVLRQLQQLFKRMPDPAAFLGGYQELVAGMFWRELPGSWQGPSPKDFLASWCKQQGLPSPCYNVFEHGKSSTAKTHFCATCILPHTGLQLTPDASYRTPLEAIHNSALLAALYLEGALQLDNPMVHFAPAGNMAKVLHGHLTMVELEEGDANEMERQRAARERELQAKASSLQRQIAALQRQPERAQPGQLELMASELAETQRALELNRPSRGGGAGAARAGGGQGPVRGGGGAGVPGPRSAEKAARPAPFPPSGPPSAAKRQRVPLSLHQALAALPPSKNPIQAVKEVCDKCRWNQPRYNEIQRGTSWLVTASLDEARLRDVEGAMHPDKRQAKLLAAETLLGFLRKQGVAGGGAGAPA